MIARFLMLGLLGLHRPNLIRRRTSLLRLDNGAELRSQPFAANRKSPTPHNEMRKLLGFMGWQANDGAVLEERFSQLALRLMQGTPDRRFRLHRLALHLLRARASLFFVLLRRSVVDDAMTVECFDCDGRNHIAAARSHAANPDLRLAAYRNGGTNLAKKMRREVHLGAIG